MSDFDDEPDAMTHAAFMAEHDQCQECLIDWLSYLAKTDYEKFEHFVEKVRKLGCGKGRDGDPNATLRIRWPRWQIETMARMADLA